MANTREALRALGRQNVEAIEVAEGQKVLANMIADTLRKAGITSAVSFTVELNNGERFVIASQQHPRLSTPAADVKSVTPNQSARAGKGNLVPFFTSRF